MEPDSKVLEIVTGNRSCVHSMKRRSLLSFQMIQICFTRRRSASEPQATIEEATNLPSSTFTITFTFTFICPPTSKSPRDLPTASTSCFNTLSKLRAALIIHSSSGSRLRLPSTSSRQLQNYFHSCKSTLLQRGVPSSHHCRHLTSSVSDT